MRAGVIRKLTCLQELWIYPAADVAKHFVKELGLLRELRVLHTRIDITGESMERALLGCLGNLHNIRELHILGSSSIDKRKMTSDAGFISCRHLRFLSLDWFTFSVLPPWIKPAPNLSYLSLNLLVVEEQDMEILARLPELQCLVLHSRDPKSVAIKIRTKRIGYFRKLRILKIVGACIWCDNPHGSECNDSGSSSVASPIMPSLESLEFDVHVRSIKDDTLLGFDNLLGFENLGTASLQTVIVNVNCGGAHAWEVEEVEAAFVNALHPIHPTPDIKLLQEYDVISTYQEACMNLSRNPELVNKVWKKLANNIRSRHIQALRVPDPAASSSKVIRLLYRQSGSGLLALDSNAVHKLWKWECSYKSSRGKATTSVPPQLWQPKSGILMTNDLSNGNPEEATACVAISKNDNYVVSATGGRLSLFNINTFEVMTTFMPPPPAATFIAFHPQDNNIMAIGMEDSSIIIDNIHIDEVQMVLRGHEKKISGLAFSQLKNVLVSSGADAQLCVWSMDGWEKMNSRYNQPPANHSEALVGDTTVQFHPDQIHIFVVHGTQLTIYDWELEYFCSWSPRDALPSLVSSAVYSSDGFLVYAGFCDGAIGIFEAKSLTLQCRIAPSVYIPSSVSSGGETIYPTVVAANPWKPSQMAVGMSDGAVYVMEPPLDTEIKVESNASSRQFPLGGSSNGGGDGQQDVF